MKKIIFCSSLLLAVLSNKSSAQFMIGPQAGLNIATLTGTSLSVSSKPGWDAGVFVSIPLGKHFSVMPAAIYSMRGFKYDYDTVTKTTVTTAGDTVVTTVDVTTKVNAILGYLDVPVLLTYFTQENKGFIIQAGPRISFLITNNSEINSTANAITTTNGTTTSTNTSKPKTSVAFKSSDVSLVAGVGYKFEKLLMLYARASTGFGSVQDANFTKDSNAGHNLMFEAGAALCFGAK
jgi:hypothetical protein